MKMRPSTTTLLVMLISLASASVTGHAISSTGLGPRLDSLVNSTRSSSKRMGVYVKSLKSGRTLYEHNGEKSFIPASNVKIIISAAALSLLKPNYRFKTELYSHGRIEGGVLRGDLYIKGYGDPTLHSRDLRIVAKEFSLLGIKSVTGSIYADESYFDSRRYGKGWKKKWKDVSYSPPVSALSLNYNTYNINIYPTRVGSRPRIEVKPESTDLKVINNAVTSTRRGNVFGRLSTDGRSITISGRISPSVSYHRVTKSVRNPATYTARTLRYYLAEAGIEARGRVVIGKVPSGASLIYTHYSDTLDTIVTTYSKESVNIIGENLIKHLGAKFMGAPGTWNNGAWVVSEFMDEIGVRGQVSLVDGSGLSKLNQTTPRSFIEVLGYAYSNKSIALPFVTSLSISGVDGTLRKRFRDSELEGRIMAKTGYLDGVRTLSGYVFTKWDDVIAFSILANGMGAEAKKIQYSILESLVDCCSDSRYH